MQDCKRKQNRWAIMNSACGMLKKCNTSKENSISLGLMLQVASPVSHKTLSRAWGAVVIFCSKDFQQDGRLSFGKMNEVIPKSAPEGGILVSNNVQRKVCIGRTRFDVRCVLLI